MKSTTAIVLIVLALILSLTFTNSQYNKVKEISVTHDEYKSVLENINRIVETRDRLLLSYTQIPKAELSKLAKILPANIDTVKLALDINSIASRYGIGIDNISIDDNRNTASTPNLPQFGRPYEKVTIAFNFGSDYENFRRFLSNMEISLRVIDVESIDFQRDDSSNTYEHHVVIRTNWLKESDLSFRENKDLLNLATTLSSINFNQAIFSTPGYKLLTDFTSPITSQPVGRNNPFEVIGRD